MFSPRSASSATCALNFAEWLRLGFFMDSYSSGYAWGRVHLLALYAAIDKIACAHAPVLITGESGVGKELAALAIHRASSRHAGAFIPVNCGAIPDTLIETHLFGHDKGAFTGAYNKQIGSIAAADGGTILLDEIGDLPITSQASLLRFLQESTVARIGSTRQTRIDARVIAATHVDLATAVRAGRFREELFYRLNVLPVDVPPLRERSTDIIPLANHIFEGNRVGKAPGVRGFSADARAAMQRHFWPGNIRELINRIHRAMVMCDGPLITAKDLQLSAREPVAIAFRLPTPAIIWSGTSSNRHLLVPDTTSPQRHANWESLA